MTDQVEVLPLLMRNSERNMARAKYNAAENPLLGLQSTPHVRPFPHSHCCRLTKEVLMEVVSTLPAGPVGSLAVAELDWGNKQQIAAVQPPFDYIIGTDVVSILSV